MFAPWLSACRPPPATPPRTPAASNPKPLQNARLLAHLKASNATVEAVALHDARFANALELAVRFGKTLVVTEADRVHPLLFPLLRRDLVRQGPRFAVQVGDKVVDFNEAFRLFLVTRHPAPYLPPDAQSLVTVANFSVTRTGLEGAPPGSGHRPRKGGGAGARALGRGCVCGVVGCASAPCAHLRLRLPAHRLPSPPPSVLHPRTPRINPTQAQASCCRPPYSTRSRSWRRSAPACCTRPSRSRCSWPRCARASLMMLMLLLVCVPRSTRAWGRGRDREGCACCGPGGKQGAAPPLRVSRCSHP